MGAKIPRPSQELLEAWSAPRRNILIDSAQKPPVNYVCMRILVIPCDPARSPRGKRYAVELHFDTGIFAGTKLVDYSVWDSKYKPGDYNVRFPSRRYEKDGKIEYWDLHRPIDPEDKNAGKLLRDTIIAEVRAFETAHINPEPIASQDPL